MRKTIYSLVVGVYFLLSGGVVVQLHFCMDRLAAIALFSDKKADTCDDCGMDMNADNDCCQDRTDVIKLVQDQLTHNQSAQVDRPEYELPDFLYATAGFFRLPTSSQSTKPLLDTELGHDRYRYRQCSVYRI